MIRPAARAPTPAHVWTGVPAPARAWTGVIGLTIMALAVGLVGLSTVSSHAATGDETDYEHYFQLETAYSFVVLAATAISNSGETVLTGDVGIHPNNETSVTGFPPGVIVGAEHFGDAAAEQAKLDLDQAYADAAALTGSPLGVELGGTSPPPGVYSGGTFGITAGAGPLVLDGTATDVWVFQVGTTLTTSGVSEVVLQGEADPCNVFWQVGSSATLGAGSTFVGTIMARDDISLGEGASVDGRLLARGETAGLGAVTLLNNSVTSPVCATAAVEPPADPPAQPIVEPTVEPTDEPTVESTDEPTDEATVEPTDGTTDETIVDEPTTDVPTTDVPTTDVPTTDVPTTDVPTTDVPTQGVVPPTRIDTGAGGASSGGPGMPTLLVGTLLMAAVAVRRATQHRGRRLVN